MSERSGLWRNISNYKFNSIFVKNFFLIVFLLVIPFIIESISAYHYFDNTLYKEIEDSNVTVLSKVRDIVDVIGNEVNNLTFSVALQRDVQLFLGYRFSSPLNYSNVERLQNINSNIISLKSISKCIDSVYIYSDLNDYIITSGNGGGKLDRILDNTWYDTYVQNRMHDNFWICARNARISLDKSMFTRVISFFRTVPLYDSRCLGVVIININLDKIEQLMNNASNSSFDNLFIVDQTGSILYAQDRSLIHENIVSLEGLGGVLQNKGSFVNNIKGVQQVISSIDSNVFQWKLISVIPLKRYQAKVTYMRYFMTMCVIIAIVIAIIMTFIISLRAFKPIKNIMNILDNPGEYKLFGESVEDKEFNEYKYIASNIINSFAEQRQMHDELEQRLIMLKKAQTIALQSQISPHFIYNTLETINWTAIGLLKGQNDISKMITSLSKLLRISLETQDQLLPIYKETEHAKRYIEIQEIRFKDKFEVEWNLSESIMNYKITKITLQPIIENAIRHGIKPKITKGHIIINGYEKDDQVIIEVIDDGKGIEDEKLAFINAQLQSYANNEIKENDHIGVSNVNQRIKIIFGERYGMKLFKMDQGTKVEVQIPKVQ